MHLPRPPVRPSVRLSVSCLHVRPSLRLPVRPSAVLRLWSEGFTGEGGGGRQGSVIRLLGSVDRPKCIVGPLRTAAAVTARYRTERLNGRMKETSNCCGGLNIHHIPPTRNPA